MNATKLGTPRRRLLFAALALACLASTAPALRAQEHPNVAKGFAPQGSIATGDVDTVNPFNGNLTIALPLGQRYPADGDLSYGLTLVYNSQVWEQQQYIDIVGGQEIPRVQSLPAKVNNAGLGWMISLGRLNPPAPTNDFDVARDTYMSPDGSRHTFYPTLHEGEPTVVGVQYTRDNSYLRFKVAAREVEFPDGSVHRFDLDGYPTQIRDAFANAINVRYLDVGGLVTSAPNAVTWEISDPYRTHYVRFRSASGVPYQAKLVDQVDLAAFGGARAVYSFLYNLDEGLPVSLTGCENTDTQTQNVAVAELTRLSLPDGTTYRMPVADHFPNSPGSFPTVPCQSGLLAKMTLPTLGAIAWDYAIYRYPVESTRRGFWQRTTGVGSRTLIDASGGTVGIWTYGTVLSNVPVNQTKKELVNTATDPLGNRTVRYFEVCANGCPTLDHPYQYGLPLTLERAGDGTGRYLSSEVFNSAGALERTEYLRYEHDADPLTFSSLEDKTRLNQRLVSQRTVYQEGAGASSIAEETLSDFDGFGHFRGRTTGGTFPGNNVRTAFTGYNPGQGTYGQPGFVPWPTTSPWILGTYFFDWESEGAQLIYRSYCFDATGFLLGRRTHAANDGSYSAKDLVTVFSKGTKGNLAAESSFGGDPQALPIDPNGGFGFTCGTTGATPAVYKTTHTYSGGVRASSSYTVGGTTFKVLDQTIDASTARASSSRDAAGVQTTYSYDPSGRPLSISPAQTARTTYTYRNATNAATLARVTIAQVSSGNATLAEWRITFDGLGRPTDEEERMPSGSWENRRTNFNALGSATYVSAQGAIGSGTSYLNFDAFGRPGTIRPADGNTHDVLLTYFGTRQIDRRVKVATSSTAETFATTSEIYDRFGRLYEVVEPNGTRTRYEYDAGNRLKRVCQAVSGSSCGQERLFTYDNRGLLLWENHPEKSANTFGQGHDVDYPSYDARGHVLRKVDGENDLTFGYDKAERLTLVRDTGSGFTDCVNNGGRRCWKTFAFATANGAALAGGTDYKKGKLTNASRFNYVGAPFNATDEVKTFYEYGGRGGRTSRRETSHVFAGTPKENFRQTFVWDELGTLAEETYPDCVTLSLCGPSSPRTVTYGWTNGRLTSVSGFASSISYHPHGAVARVTRTNGTSDVYDRDANWLPRPAAISTQRTSDALTLFTTGAYGYDGSGNVKKMGNATFVYDALSRLTSGTVYPGRLGDGVAQTQSYGFDNYGNITGITTNSVFRSTPTSTATNRLNAAGTSYDAAGNLKAWNGNQYEYDALNQMTKMVSGAEDWRYLYDADDERFWSYRAGGGAGSLWTLRGLSGQSLREYQSHLSWSHFTDSVYRGAALLASVPSAAAGGGISHLHTDHLGTPRLITNSAGNVGSFHAYYPFGEELAATFSAAFTDRLRFTGHERDLANPAGAGDDLDYMHARHCSPLTGRFLSVDPAETFEPVAPQTWNRYAYVTNAPLKYLDPTGAVLEAFYLVTGTFTDLTQHSALYIRDDEPGREVDLVFSNGGQASGVQDLETYLSVYDEEQDPTTAFRLNLDEDQVRHLQESLLSDYRKTSAGYVGPQYDELTNNCAQYSCRKVLEVTGGGTQLFADTIQVVATRPIILSQQALAVLYGVGLLGERENIHALAAKRGAQVIYFWRYAPPK